jgi:hypothetical protein
MGMTKRTDYHARHGQKKLTIWLDAEERALLEVAARAAGTSKKQAVVKGLRLVMSEHDGGKGLQMSEPEKCNYPDCNCPLDMGPHNLCARGLTQ